jgi:class 3 adenylate cyclase
MNTFRQIYQEAKAINDTGNIQSALINLGAIKGLIPELDSAYFFFRTAAEMISPKEDMVSYLDLQYNLANIDIRRKKFQEARVRLDTLYALAERSENLPMIAATQNARATLYAAMKNFEKAYGFLGEFIGLQEKILNEERVNAVTEMMEKYESEKKARLIRELEVENLDATLQNERIRNTRNRYLYIGGGVFIIALGLFGRLQYVRKAKKAIQREKDISEGLLLNILPASVAGELKAKGYAEARHYDEATILFSDFKSFTTIAGEMSATDLVNEINDCFKAFDEIMTIHGLEKIKTIGDSYMAAGAIPGTNSATALDVVKAGLSMQEFIVARRKDREALHLPAFEMRIGIHTGPVVAGIVGVKKFQYDLWGDTVNIASRMETNSEPGFVNISATTYQLVKDDPTLSFTPRGMLPVKGKGDMEMYFVGARDKG